MNFCNNFGLHQFVSEPTLGDNILDVVSNNDPYIVNSLYLSAPFRNNDHYKIHFSLILSPDKSAKDEKYVYDFDNCDVDTISRALSTHPLHFSIPYGSADDALDQFFSHLMEVIDGFDAYVPLKKFRSAVSLA